MLTHYPTHDHGISAHRASWVIHFGDIPEGMYVCHRCDNPPCVNPAHLFLGSPLDNQTDRIAKGRGAAGEQNPAHKLCRSQVNEIRELHRMGLRGNKLAERYSVSTDTISSIVNYHTWK
jgi:hypothetical protein